MAKIIDLSWIEDEAQELFAEHNLIGWKFSFDNAKMRFGICYYNTHEIQLSRPLCLINDETQIRDVLLHEVAHAIAGHDAGHGIRWKNVAMRIGADPVRCYDDETVNTPDDHVWEGECNNCGKVMATRYRETQKMYRLHCKPCAREFGFGPENKLNWWKVR